MVPQRRGGPPMPLAILGLPRPGGGPLGEGGPDLNLLMGGPSSLAGGLLNPLSRSRSSRGPELLGGPLGGPLESGGPRGGPRDSGGPLGGPRESEKPMDLEGPLPPKTAF